jgi:hypothetical protein
MVRNTQNYCVFAISPSSGILQIRNTTFRKLDLFLPSGEEGENSQLSTRLLSPFA